MTENTLQKPGFWRVVLGYMMDSVIVGLIFFVALIKMAKQIALLAQQGPVFIYCVLLSIYGVLILYFSLLDYFCEGSAGKQATGIGVFMKKKSIWRLGASYLIDSIVSLGVTLLLLVVAIFLYKYFNVAQSLGNDAVAAGMFSLLLLGFVFCCGVLFSFSLREGLFGASLGKACMGISVYKK